MNKIAQYAYHWVENVDGGTSEFVKKPDGVNADSEYTLSDVLDDARASRIITKQEAEMLRHIIPCCRKDKSKRDFIEVLLNNANVD